MRRNRTIWFGTLVAFLVMLLSPAAQAVWQCEGRTCGTSLWVCCCNAPEPSQDEKCGEVIPHTRREAGAVCPTDCGCVLTVRSLDAERRGHQITHVAPDFQPALLQPAQTVRLAASAAPLERNIESRGPPPGIAGLPAAGLRAPPGLTFTIGC